MKNKPNAICLLFVPLAAAALAAGCGGKESAETRRLTVRWRSKPSPAATRAFERRLTVQGTLEARNFANVAARAAGNLDALWADEGDAVVAGTTALFQVDPASRKNALTIAEQNLAVAEASLEVAKASAGKTKAESRKASLDFERFTRLHKDGKVSLNEFEAAEVAIAQARAGIAVADAQVDLAERQVKQAEASLAMAQKNLDDTKIMAPISGVVSSHAEPGEYMAVGNVILRIDDLATVETAAFLPPSTTRRLSPAGQSSALSSAGATRAKSTVTYRSPTINPSLRTFEIKGIRENARRLPCPARWRTWPSCSNAPGLGIARPRPFYSGPASRWFSSCITARPRPAKSAPGSRTTNGPRYSPASRPGKKES